MPKVIETMTSTCRSNYRFWVPGKPFGKQRPRVCNGHAFTPQETVDYENLVRLCFRKKYPQHIPADGQYMVCIIAIFPIPKSWSKKKRELALKCEILPGKPDWDNIGKIICDALNGVLYEDDACVYGGCVFKRYGEREGVDVTVAQMRPEPVTYVKMEEK